MDHDTIDAGDPPVETGTVETRPLETPTVDDAPEPAARRPSRGSARRVPALIGAAILVAAGLLFALLGMRAAVARIPATPPPSPARQSPGVSPQPTSVPTPAGTPRPTPPRQNPSP